MSALADKWRMIFVVWPLRLSLLLLPLVMLPDSFTAPKGLVFMGLCVVLGLGCLLGSGAVRVPFLWPLVGFGLICLLQWSRSLNPDHAAWLLVIQVGGLFVGCVTAALVDHRQVVSLARYFAVGALVVSLLGILEYLGVGWASLPSAGRPSATFGFRNIAGMYLAVGLPVVFLLVFQRRHLDAVLGFLATGSMTAFLIFTRTRGAWLGVLIALCVGLVLAWRVCTKEGALLVSLWSVMRTRLWGVGLVVIVGALVMFVPPRFSDATLSRMDETKTQVATTITSIARPGGDRGRFRIWQHTMEMIVAHPLFGVGLDNWSALYPKYDRGDVIGIEVAPERPHNDWLWFWSELGSVGFFVYLFLLWVIVRQFWRCVHLESEMALPILCVGMGALALFVHSCFSFPRMQPSAVLPLWIALGIVGGGQAEKWASKWGMRVCGILGIVVGGYGCWLGGNAIVFDRAFFAAQITTDGRVQIRETERALDRGLFDHRILLLKGLGQTAQGDYEAAVETYQKYLTYQPYLPALYNNLGQVYEKLDNLEAAKQAYSKGLEIFNHEGMLLNNLAAVYKKQGDVDRALGMYEKAPNLPADGQHNLGLIYAERGEFDRALVAYAKALQQDPNMTVVYFSMGGVRLLKGDFERAAIDLETFLSRWTGVQDYVRDAHLRLRQLYPVLGDRYVKAGDWQKAKAVYERLLSLGGESAEVYGNLAMIYGRAGSNVQALDAGQKALVLDDTFAPAHFALAVTYDQMGNSAEALVHYQRFVMLYKMEDPLLTRAKRRVAQLRKP